MTAGAYPGSSGWPCGPGGGRSPSIALVFELNAPNVLTLLRISLVPVLAAVLLSALPDADLLAAVVFVGAPATAALDGCPARRPSMITAFGKLMDPPAD